jgi:hypothetical protein
MLSFVARKMLKHKEIDVKEKTTNFELHKPLNYFRKSTHKCFMIQYRKITHHVNKSVLQDKKKRTPTVNFDKCIDLNYRRLKQAQFGRVGVGVYALYP